MRLIIAGCREFNDYNYFVKAFHQYGPPWAEVTQVLSGRSPKGGVDRLGERWAQAWQKDLLLFPAEWVRYGPSAGPRRNALMATKADALFVLWDAVSRGTRDMLHAAAKRQLRIWAAGTPGVNIVQALRNEGLSPT